jgi:hypothetical protein
LDKGGGISAAERNDWKMFAESWVPFPSLWRGQSAQTQIHRMAVAGGRSGILQWIVTDAGDDELPLIVRVFFCSRLSARTEERRPLLTRKQYSIALPILPGIAQPRARGKVADPVVRAECGVGIHWNSRLNPTV